MKQPGARLASITALLVSAVAVGVMLQLLPLVGGKATRTGSGSLGALPWPYCAPDATPPPPPETPWPPLPPAETAPGGHGWRSTLDPMVDAIVSPSSIVLGGVRDSGVPGVTLQDATVTIDDVVWQTAFESSLEVDFPVTEGTRIMVSSRDIWVQAAEALLGGADVLIGVQNALTTGYYVSFALDADPQAPTFFGTPPISDRDTGQFRAFLNWEGNPLQDTDPTHVLVAWNVELDAPTGTGTGPISVSWSRFLDQFSGEDYPSPGTPAWWAKAPPECRSLLDAPQTILEDLPWADVWIHVPPSWRGLTDGAMCLQIPTLGSAGCADTSEVSATFPYLHFDEVQTVPGIEVQVTYSKEKGDAISHVEEVLLGAIPFDVFISTGAVLVELDPSATPVSFAQLAADPNASERATSRALTQAENDGLLAGVPAAQRVT